MYGNIIQSLHETAKVVLGERHKRHSCKMWWTDEIEGIVAKKNIYIYIYIYISEMVKHKKL